MSASVVVAAPEARPSSRRLYRDAASLASSSMITALLGIGFWAVCAKLIPPATLGVQTALLSIIVAPALVIASGVGDAFTALVPASGPDRARVVARGYRILLITSALFGIVAAALAVTLLPQVRGSVYVALAVAVGVVVWALFVVQDPALTSMRRAHWLPIENGSVSLLKIALLPVLIAVGVAQPAVVATLVPSLLAVGVLFPQVKRLARTLRDDDGTTIVGGAPDHLSRLVVRTTTSVALSLGTLTATPFIVTAAAGPKDGAVFSLGLNIVQSLDFVGAALGVSLVVHASSRAAESGRMALGVFKRTAAVVGLGAIALVAVSPFVLRLLNPSYVHLHGPALIAVLAVGSFLRTPYVIWAALQRSRRDMRPLLVLNSVAAIVVFALLPLAAHRWGAIGAGVVVALAQAVLSGGCGLHMLTTYRRGEQSS